jgi:microcystin-dependent protein
MAEPFLGEIRLMACEYEPKGWALCNGQILSISQNQALFALLGTTYGGDGVTTFALPDLRGRVPLHASRDIQQGQRAGEEKHTLTPAEMPMHTHRVNAFAGAGDSASGSNAFLAEPDAHVYAEWQAAEPMTKAAAGAAGSGRAHENMSPFTVLNFVICLYGIFPSRN